MDFTRVHATRRNGLLNVKSTFIHSFPHSFKGTGLDIIATKKTVSQPGAHRVLVNMDV